MKKLQRVKPFKNESSLILEQIKEYDEANPLIEIPFPVKNLTWEFMDDIECLLGRKK